MATKLLIPEKILIPLMMVGLLFTFISVSFDLTSFGIPLAAGKILQMFGLIANFIVAMVLIVDVFKNNLSARYLWTLGFLIFAPIVGYFYVRNRESYLRPSGKL